MSNVSLFRGYVGVSLTDTLNFTQAHIHREERVPGIHSSRMHRHTPGMPATLHMHLLHLRQYVHYHIPTHKCICNCVMLVVDKDTIIIIKVQALAPCV